MLGAIQPLDISGRQQWCWQFFPWVTGVPSRLSQLREFASHLQQLQGALNDLTDEHSKASREWVEKQAQLEKEVGAALQDKVTLPSGVRATI